MPLEKNQNLNEMKESVHDLTKQVQYLKDDLTKIKVLTDKIDTMINKLSDVTVNISQLIAVHEQKFVYQDKAIEHLIATINLACTDFSRKDDIIFTEIEILENKIDEKRTDLGRSLESKIDNMKKEMKEQYDNINSKLAFLEKFMWIATGGAAVVGFIIATISKLIKF